MWLEIYQKEVGTISEKILDNILNNIEEGDWTLDDYRNGVGNMEDSNSIPIHHTPLCASGMRGFEPIKSIRKELLYPKYFPLIKPVLEELKKYYTYNHYAAFLSRLRPGGKIGFHKDSGSFLDTCHRIHVPLQTSPNVHYVIEEKSYYWEKGKIYEFNNLLTHGVLNNDPNVWRIHLVINLYNLTNEQLQSL